MVRKHDRTNQFLRPAVRGVTRFREHRGKCSLLSLYTKHFFDLNTDPWPFRFYDTRLTLLAFLVLRDVISVVQYSVDLGLLSHVSTEYKRVLRAFGITHRKFAAKIEYYGKRWILYK